MTYTCLIIERDRLLSREVEREFPGFGFRPFPVQSSASALNILRQWQFDAALLDADGFGADYVDILRNVRATYHSPLVMLSSVHDEQRQLLGLESGATAVMAKPISPRLMCAKLARLIESAGHRPEPSSDEVRLGPLLMDAKRGLAVVGEAPIKLTIQEFELLYLLASHPGQFVDRETIVRTLRGSAESIGRGVDVHVYRIRRKLKQNEVDSLRLDTIYGRGYCLTLQGPVQQIASLKVVNGRA
jgi:two-component system, OmpR family, response regulator ParR